MTTIKELETIEEWQNLLEASTERKVFLFKHSTTCPISSAADKEFRAFASDYNGSDADFAFLKVRESRPVSNAISEDLSVKHESPQIFILENKEVKWSDSHWNITKKKIEDAIS
ncbi:bacillithiol system redox-active protein YtxJ [bacterium LRH843]|nr:bacillithiol system redox-active protein YtxJ [bacterium LRH843]